MSFSRFFNLKHYLLISILWVKKRKSTTAASKERCVTAHLPSGLCQISRNETHNMQTGSDAVSQNKTRFSTESLPVIYVAHI